MKGQQVEVAGRPAGSVPGRSIAGRQAAAARFARHLQLHLVLCDSSGWEQAQGEVELLRQEEQVVVAQWPWARPSLTCLHLLSAVTLSISDYCVTN